MSTKMLRCTIFFIAPQSAPPNALNPAPDGIRTVSISTTAKPKVNVVVDPKYNWIAGNALRYDIS